MPLRLCRHHFAHYSVIRHVIDMPTPSITSSPALPIRGLPDASLMSAATRLLALRRVMPRRAVRGCAAERLRAALFSSALIARHDLFLSRCLFFC